MKIVALDVDGSHFVIGDLNAFLIEVAIEIACDREAVFGRVAPISWTMTWWLTSGLPRQFSEM